MKKARIGLAALGLSLGVAGAFATNAPSPQATVSYSGANCTGTVISPKPNCSATAGVFCYSQKIDNLPCTNWYHD